jgi:hypothetical protein
MALQEYIITLKNKDDLEGFYTEMESIVPTAFLPIRPVPVHNRRPLSRNTHYLLNHDEAESIKADVRVAGVTLAEPLRNSIKLSANWTVTAPFNKGTNISSPEKNWGLLRCTNRTNIPNWGLNNTPLQTSTVNYLTSGKNVDVVIVDGYVNPSHPELQVNLNGTGGSRVNQFDWYTLNEVVVALTNTANPLHAKYGYPTSFPSTPESTNNHATAVAGIVAGNTNGWARDANIYNLCVINDTINTLDNLLIFDYIRAFHSYKPVNPLTNKKNPTICNCSYGRVMTFPDPSNGNGPIVSAIYRGNTISQFGFALSSAQLTIAGIYNTIVNGNVTATIPFYSVAEAADIEDAIADGVIVVGAAGNNSQYIDISTGIDYNNSFTASTIGLYQTFYQNRGFLPSATPGVICVGSASALSDDSISTFSNHGPRIDIIAPGENIITSTNSVYPSDADNMLKAQYIVDLRNPTYYFSKLSGTSLSCPQVAGVLACLMESYPTITPSDALWYLQNNSTNNYLYAPQIPFSNSIDTTLHTTLSGSNFPSTGVLPSGSVTIPFSGNTITQFNFPIQLEPSGTGTGVINVKVTDPTLSQVVCNSVVNIVNSSLIASGKLVQSNDITSGNSQYSVISLQLQSIPSSVQTLVLTQYNGNGTVLVTKSYSSTDLATLPIQLNYQVVQPHPSMTVYATISGIGVLPTKISNITIPAVAPPQINVVLPGILTLGLSYSAVVTSTVATSVTTSSAYFAVHTSNITLPSGTSNINLLYAYSSYTLGTQISTPITFTFGTNGIINRLPLWQGPSITSNVSNNILNRGSSVTFTIGIQLGGSGSLYYSIQTGTGYVSAGDFNDSNGLTGTLTFSSTQTSATLIKSSNVSGSIGNKLFVLNIYSNSTSSIVLSSYTITLE